MNAPAVRQLRHRRRTRVQLRSLRPPSSRAAWGLDLCATRAGKWGAGSIGGLLFMAEGQSASPPTYHFAYDGNGNVTRLGDSTGATAAAYEYGPFGESLTVQGSHTGNPFRFSTKYADVETGLVYYGYRYYNASTGRWLSRDPIEEEGGYGLYAFVGNRQVDTVDPLGLRELEVAFVAFINGARRGSWLPDPSSVPGIGRRSGYELGTDLRGFGEFNFSFTQPNARLASIGGVVTSQLGSAQDGNGAFGLSVAGVSRRRAVRYHLLFDVVYGPVESREAVVHSGVRVGVTNRRCETRLRFNPRARYPFVRGAPSLRYDVTFSFRVIGSDQVAVTVDGSHGSFPDFEVYIDGRTVYTYSSPDDGPGFNVTRWVRIPSRSVTVSAPTSCECN